MLVMVRVHPPLQYVCIMNKIRRGYKIQFPDNHLELIISVKWVHWRDNKKHKRLCISTNETFDISLENKRIIKNFK